MSTTSLVAEYLVIGVTPFLAILFAILSVFRVYDLSFLSQAKDFSSLLVLGTSLSVYLLGALTHHLVQLVDTRRTKFLLRLPVMRSALGQSEPTNVEEWVKRRVLMFQFGSDRLVEDIERSWSLVRVYEATAFTTPMLAIPLSTWLLGWVGWKGAMAAIIVCMVLAAAAGVCFISHRRNHWRFVQIAGDLMREVKEHSQALDRAR